MMGQITERFPGISCAYMDAAGSITTECYGVADRENHIPVDETTLFPACSISKFVTAIGVMKLHGNGVIDIDCGCGLKTEYARLACLRLNDMAEFYV